LLGVIAPGECESKLSLLTDQARIHDVRALRDCIVLRLPCARFERLQGSHPEALLAASRRMLERLLARDMGEPLVTAAPLLATPL
jgi:CRP-like cAMP-binding protein